MEKTYYLFGQDAVKIYDNEGIEGLKEASESNEISINTFVFIEGETRSGDFAEAFFGWLEYAILTEEEFNQL